MKKLFILLTLAATLVAEGAQFTVQSLLSANVSAIVISNNVGVTNLNYIAQAGYQGLYQLGTNNAGTSITTPIATNATLRMGLCYTDAVPVVWFGQTYPGSFVTLTNNSVASTLSTNDFLYVTVNTNNQFNFLGDANLPQDFYNALVTDAGLPGVVGNTNSIGYIQVVTQPFSLYGIGPSGGSNIVNLLFSPVANNQTINPGHGAPIPGYTPGWETSFNDGLWLVTYTNQAQAIGLPTVFQAPVPRWVFPYKNMRLRAIWTGVSTNAICVNSVTYHSWVP